MRLSYSKLSCFERCPMEYFLTYRSSPVRQNTGIAQYGSFVHSLLERWANGSIPPERLAHTYDLEYDGAVTLPLPEGKSFDYYVRGKKYFESFHGVLSGYSPEMLMTERKLTAQFSTWELSGVLDLVLKLDDGRCALVDHKSSLRRSFYGAKGNERKRQLYIYSYLLNECCGYLPDLLCFNLFRENHELCFDFVKEDYDESLMWMEMTGRELSGLIQACPDAPFAWEPRPSYYWCAHVCAVRQQCPSGGKRG